METDLFPANLIRDVEYFVIMSDVMKKLDCIIPLSHICESACEHTVNLESQGTPQY